MLDRLYELPPLSTEQVLHPEKYGHKPEWPTLIRIDAVEELFPPEWQEIDSDTLGELSIHCLFRQFLGPTEAKLFAEGWGGDCFVAYRRRHDEVAFIWATSWDTARDAEEFYAKYREILALKYGRSTVEARAHVEKRDQVVIVIEGLEPNLIAANIGAVWATMTLEKQSFQTLLSHRASGIP